ncbi:MAG: hypothetical protein GY847_09720, partial [Proteobacteria bacterium]|nr:hypothetical protein [Pseudomonadota bacterium]
VTVAVEGGGDYLHKTFIEGDLNYTADFSGKMVEMVADVAIGGAGALSKMSVKQVVRQTANVTKKGLKAVGKTGKGIIQGKGGKLNPLNYKTEGFGCIFPDVKYRPKTSKRGLSTSNDAVGITLRHVEGMPGNEFMKKAQALKELGERGLLTRAANPVARNRAMTRAYRQDMIHRIWSQYGQRNPEFANSLINRVTRRMQPDHVWELQPNGPDVTSLTLRAQRHDFVVLVSKNVSLSNWKF